MICAEYPNRHDIANFRTRKMAIRLPICANGNLIFTIKMENWAKKKPWILAFFSPFISEPKTEAKTTMVANEYYGNAKRQFNDAGQCNLESASTASNFLLCK